MSWSLRPAVPIWAWRLLLTAAGFSDDGHERPNLKHLSTGPGTLAQISDRICPERLEMDRQGKRLYVPYQCSGPMVSPGYDSAGIFDAEKERSRGFVSGPPMAGGPAIGFSRRKLVLLRGLDACWNPE